ncbi:hypothetical protein [Megalodesulfovibrio paquesii]
METLSELWHNMLQSTLPGTLGVIGIFTYMGLILTTAMYRIFKGDHMHH